MLSNFILLVKKKFRQKRFHNLIKKFFIVVPFAVQHSFAFRLGAFEVVGNARFVRTQSLRLVKVLIADVHFNISKNPAQNVFYMSTETNWSYLLLFRRCRFLIRFCLFFILFCFLGIVSLVTTILETFQFPSQIRLSQTNILAFIRFEFNLYAVFIVWTSRINFLFVVRQDIINYWDLLSKISRNCQKRSRKYFEMICKIVCKIVSSQPIGLFCRCCWRDLEWCVFPAITTCLFSQSSSCNTLRLCPKTRSSTNNLWGSGAAFSNNVSTHKYCSWKDLLTQKSCKCPINFATAPKTLLRCQQLPL